MVIDMGIPFRDDLVIDTAAAAAAAQAAGPAAGGYGGAMAGTFQTLLPTSTRRRCLPVWTIPFLASFPHCELPSLVAAPWPERPDGTAATRSAAARHPPHPLVSAV